jgi:hypothetical protein
VLLGIGSPYQKLLSEAGLKPAEGRSTFSESYARKLALYKAKNSAKRRKEIRHRRLLAGAKKSTGYTRSRRSLVMQASVERRKLLGLKTNEPMCLCGTCELCKARRRKKLRKEKRDNSFYWDHEQPPSLFEIELAERTMRVR